MRLFLAAVLAAGACFGQNEPAKPPAEEKFFRLDFVVKELDGGKVINSRAYAMTATTGRLRTSVRMGNKLPVHRGGQVQYHDVGTNIDCSDLKEEQNHVKLWVSAEVSSVVVEQDAMVRQVKWVSPVIVPTKKPTTIFSSDDPTSKRQMQLELTATPIR